MERCDHSSSPIRICPLSLLISPTSAPANSVCPFPSIPAIQTISPALTENDTLLTTDFFVLLSITDNSFTVKISCPNFCSGLSGTRVTLRPTMSSDKYSLVIFGSLSSTVPTLFPCHRTVHLSAIAMISLSLWEIKIMDLPSLTKFRIVCMRSSISCGVSTAVGSSKIRISLSL